MNQKQEKIFKKQAFNQVSYELAPEPGMGIKKPRLDRAEPINGCELYSYPYRKASRVRNTKISSSTSIGQAGMWKQDISVHPSEKAGVLEI